MVIKHPPNMTSPFSDFSIIFESGMPYAIGMTDWLSPHEGHLTEIDIYGYFLYVKLLHSPKISQDLLQKVWSLPNRGLSVSCTLRSNIAWHYSLLKESTGLESAALIL